MHLPHVEYKQFNRPLPHYCPQCGGGTNEPGGFDVAAERCMNCKVIYLSIVPKDEHGKPTCPDADLKYLDKAMKAVGRR